MRGACGTQSHVLSGCPGTQLIADFSSPCSPQGVRGSHSVGEPRQGRAAGVHGSADGTRAVAAASSRVPGPGECSCGAYGCTQRRVTARPHADPRHAVMTDTGPGSGERGTEDGESVCLWSCHLSDRPTHRSWLSCPRVSRPPWSLTCVR